MRIKNLMTTIIVFWVGLAGFQPITLAAEPDKASSSQLIAGPVFQPFFDEIMSMNPELEAARANWRSKAALVEPAGYLPDPTLSLGLYLQEVETRVGPQQARFGISQSLPWKGKLRLKSDMAAAGAQAARRNYENLRVHLFSDFKKWVFELIYLNQAIHVTFGHVELLKEWEGLMAARYTTSLFACPHTYTVLSILFFQKYSSQKDGGTSNRHSLLPVMSESRTPFFFCPLSFSSSIGFCQMLPILFFR